MPKAMVVNVNDGSKIEMRKAVPRKDVALREPQGDNLLESQGDNLKSEKFSREYLMGLSMDDLRALIPPEAVEAGVKDTSKKGLIDEFLTWREMNE